MSIQRGYVLMRALENLFWGVYDTWTSRWLKKPRLTYLQAAEVAVQKNATEFGMTRHKVLRLPD